MFFFYYGISKQKVSNDINMFQILKMLEIFSITCRLALGEIVEHLFISV